MIILENNSWTDEYYRLAAFIYNEPQRLQLKKDGKGNMDSYAQAITNLRTLEVPLNYLFNILLKLSPQRVKRRILNCFMPPSETDFGRKIEFINNFEALRSHDLSFIYPDALLRSETSHICLELKARTGTKIELSQAYKYLRFLRIWQASNPGQRTPYLFFLTKSDLDTQWLPSERSKIFTGPDPVTSLANYLRLAPTPEPATPIEPALSQLRLGWATWQMVGQALHEEVARSRQSELDEGREILVNLLDDFVGELYRAGLWQEGK